MQNRFEKFFTNDKVMKANAILGVIAAVASSILMLVYNVSLYHFVVSALVLFMAFCVVVIVRSYFAHEKNIMKGMMGFLLAVCLVSESYQLQRIFTEEMLFNDLLSRGAAGITYIVIQCLGMLIFTAIVVSHFIINSDHHSKPKAIFFNQCIILIEAVAVVVEIFLSISFFAASTPIRAAFWSLNYLLALLCLNSIICVESKLDAYKLRRETASEK